MNGQHLDAGRIARGFDVCDNVRVAEPIELVILTLAVRVDDGSRLDDIRDEVLERLVFRVLDHTHSHASEFQSLGLLAPSEPFDRDHDDRLAARASPTFAADSDTADVALIHLHDALE